MSAIIFLIPILLAVFLIVLYALEQHANDKRIARGEKPVAHHDLTDLPAPLDVIDWTR